LQRVNGPFFHAVCAQYIDCRVLNRQSFLLIIVDLVSVPFEIKEKNVYLDFIAKMPI
jgi:hypothetical protein